jgi:DNA-directed RNA polymerase subunit RPC12/RpoP
MKDKFMKFMQGRYGVDQFCRFTMGAALVLIVLAIVTTRAGAVSALLDTLGFAAIIYTYFRIFSKNISKRYAENQKYLSMTAKIRTRFNKEKNLMKQRKTHHIYTCPSCGQKIRIPRGKGKIEIRCPKCQTKFVKRS